MLKVLALVVMVGAAMGATVPSTVTVNDAKFTLSKKFTLGAPIEFHDVQFYEAKAVATGEECVVVSGFLVSNLPDHLYIVRVKIWLWELYKNVTGPTPQTIEIVVGSPVPNRRTRFTGFVPASATNLKATHITYSLDRLSVEAHAKPKPEPR